MERAVLRVGLDGEGVKLDFDPRKLPALAAGLAIVDRPLLERYHEIYLAYEPADARYLANHRGHLMFLRPEEHEVCTADLIRTMTFTGTRPALQDRIRELREAGYNHFAISIRHGHPGMLEDWADVFAGV